MFFLINTKKLFIFSALTSFSFIFIFQYISVSRQNSKLKTQIKFKSLFIFSVLTFDEFLFFINLIFFFCQIITTYLSKRLGSRLWMDMEIRRSSHVRLDFHSDPLLIELRAARTRETTIRIVWIFQCYLSIWLSGYGLATKSESKPDKWKAAWTGASRYLGVQSINNQYL